MWSNFRSVFLTFYGTFCVYTLRCICFDFEQLLLKNNLSRKFKMIRIQAICMMDFSIYEDFLKMIY